MNLNCIYATTINFLEITYHGWRNYILNEMKYTSPQSHTIKKINQFTSLI